MIKLDIYRSIRFHYTISDLVLVCQVAGVGVALPTNRLNLPGKCLEENNVVQVMLPNN